MGGAVSLAVRESRESLPPPEEQTPNVRTIRGAFAAREAANASASTRGTESTRPPIQVQRTKTVKNHVNLRRKTLQLALAPSTDDSDRECYILSFNFDATVRGKLSIYFVAKEVKDQGGGRSTSIQPVGGHGVHMVRTFERGLGQQLRLTLPAEFLGEKLLRCRSPGEHPIVVRLETLEAAEDDPGEGDRQHQTTYASVVARPGGGGGMEVQVQKQKIWVGGVTYELCEIYGIDHGGDSADDEMGKECVVCLAGERDTTVLPCRHMCLCHACAQVLRYQTHKCPICRTPVDSLLHIANKKNGASATATHVGSVASTVGTQAEV